MENRPQTLMTPALTGKCTLFLRMHNRSVIIQFQRSVVDNGYSIVHAWSFRKCRRLLLSNTHFLIFEH